MSMNQSLSPVCWKKYNFFECLKYICCHIVLAKVRNFNSLFTSTLLCKFHQLIKNFPKGAYYNITLDNQTGFIREGYLIEL